MNKKVDLAKLPVAETVVNQSIADFGDNAMRIYGQKTNEDRAIPDMYDGLKPVQRRVMQAAVRDGARYNRPHIKTARIVGTCLGVYHPHGDTAVAGAIATMVNSSTPTMDGDGNWGDILNGDSPAAMRYCFVAGTRVATEAGLLNIEDIAQYLVEKKIATKESQGGRSFALPKRMLVDCHQPNSAGASHFVNSGVQDTVIVRTSKGYEVQCTPNEPFLVMSAFGLEWKEASRLTRFDQLCLKRTSSVARQIPKTTNEESVAKVLGYMVGDGFMNDRQNYIGFCQVDRRVFNDFLSCWNSAFSSSKASGFCSFTTSIRKPHGWGKENCNYFSCNSVEMRAYLSETYGFHSGNSYTREVPDAVWRFSSEGVAKFLSALFESDGSVQVPQRGSSVVTLHSVSERLLTQVRQLLLFHFGIQTSAVSNESTTSSGLRLIISGRENVLSFRNHIGFVSHRKNKALLLSPNTRSNTDFIPYANQLGFSDFSNADRSAFRSKVEQGYLSSDAAKKLYSYDFIYDTVASISDGGQQLVYDLTVEGAHSFVANGFVVHNTNARISKYAELVFFDSRYMAVATMIPNYDGKDKEAYILPARLPNAIINGTSGIGTGITTATPSFSVQSVLKVLRGILAKWSSKMLIDPKDVKPLQFNYPQYSSVTTVSESSAKEVRALMSNGQGKVTFLPKYEIDKKESTIRLDGYAPATNLERLMPKLRDQKWFKGLTDLTSLESAVPVFEIKVAKPESWAAMERQFVQLFSTDSRFIVNLTDRSFSGTAEMLGFNIFSMTRFLKGWLEKRIALERSSLSYQIEQKKLEIKRAKLMILAADSRAIILKVLEAKDNHDERLAKALQISVEDAKFILDLQVRRLSALDGAKWRANLKQLKAELEELQAWLKTPHKSVLNDLTLLEQQLGLKKVTK